MPGVSGHRFSRKPRAAPGSERLPPLVQKLARREFRSKKRYAIPRLWESQAKTALRQISGGLLDGRFRNFIASIGGVPMIETGSHCGKAHFFWVKEDAHVGHKD